MHSYITKNIFLFLITCICMPLPLFKMQMSLKNDQETVLGKEECTLRWTFLITISIDLDCACLPWILFTTSLITCPYNLDRCSSYALQPWNRRQQVPLKHRCSPTKLVSQSRLWTFSSKIKKVMVYNWPQCHMDNLALKLVFVPKLCSLILTTMMPASMTSTLSESMMVFSLWAIVSTVQCSNFVLIVLWIKASVL